MFAKKKKKKSKNDPTPHCPGMAGLWFSHSSMGRLATNVGGGGVETRVNALAIRGSPNKSASGRTNQILSYMVFGFTRCKIVYSSQTGRMREQTVGLP